MNNEEIRKKEEIKSALAAMSAGDFLENSKHLLAVLGYCSERTAELPGTAEDFIQRFPARNKNTETEQEFLDSAESVKLVFQVRSEEIAPNDQPTLFESPAFDKGYVRSFMFFAIELKDSDYPRGKYAQFTREVNKRFIMPIVVFFRVENRLTIGFVGRRQDKRDSDRDVLEQVTLIKDIRLDNPHRAHLEVLFELSLAECAKWMADHNKQEDFDGLLAAWLARLDTSELNKRFFNELANWYFWAVDQVKFPDDAGEDVEVRNAPSVIRLLTRLIFVWFIKEKGLVSNQLFNPDDLDDILNNLDPQESTYYKAILQNLFFATLNQEMNTTQNPNNRRFRGEGRQHYNITSLYRYKDYFIDPDNALRQFEAIPFLNGGLFECLDAPSQEDATRILRMDGFSDRDDNPLHVPNELFFLGEQSVNLNEAYGTSGKRFKVRGLIHILSSYKFTITENTPIEEEVALDPELLGKVFENLLAAYNPETKVTARKQTGSFYTPREIVNYMTDESLIAYLKNELITYSEAQRAFSVTTPPSQLDLAGQAAPVQTELGMERVLLSDEQKSEIEEKLRGLLAYNDEQNQFDGGETEVLIKAIDTFKILDPACGSGAFPMGVLHKLVFILGKLDPRNEQWRQRQIARVESTIERAEEIDDSTIRESTICDLEEEIENINEAFERNELDYGRKLYLIENCIYGVDIQPIATQIAKLRFFISLIVDQQIDDSRENYGVRPLPNLETKFVAANTLLGVDKPLQTQIRNPQVGCKEKELEDVRRKHFTARTPRTKTKYRTLDAQIRAEIGRMLKDLGFPDETTEKIAHWDPYDQNASADFFDPEWMFNVRDGFDVVIGNPPYVVSKDKQLRRIYSESVYGRPNLYGYFIHRVLQDLLANNGILTFINPRTLLTDAYCSALRTFVLRHSQINLVLNIVDRRNVFESVLQSCIVNSFQNTNTTNPIRVKSIVSKEDISNTNWVEISQDDFLFEQNDGPLFIVGNNYRVYDIFKKLKMLKSLKTHGLSFTTGKIQWDLYKAVLGNVPTPVATRLIWAENVQRYCYLDARKRADRIYINKRLEKYQPITHDTIVVQRVTAVEQPRRIIAHLFSPDSFGYPIQAENHTSYLEEAKDIHLKFVLGILNSKFIDFIFRHLNSNTQVSAGELNALPLPDSEDSVQASIINFVDQILDAKHTDPDVDVSELENQIDQIVYLLYDLTPKEIAIVAAAENV